MSNSNHIPHSAEQSQFLEVIDRDEATARFQQHLQLTPLGDEDVPLAEALGRVLADDVISTVDVPGFDRSNVDGFAVQSSDTIGAMEETPCKVKLNSETITPGKVPAQEIQAGTATTIATGGMIPRGADAVVMVEDTDVETSNDGPLLEIRRAVSPGNRISFAGSDISNGETALRRGQLLTSREIGVLAAIGRNSVSVYRKPRVAIISTGNEIVAPGGPIQPGEVFDSNAAILSAAVQELGAEPVVLGIVRDDEQKLQAALDEAADFDAIILSGGTSKGEGDLSYKAVSQLSNPGIVAHGVALKPGKPICLAVSDGKPVVILPGFPTSAIFTFHEFVAPVLRAMAGLAEEGRKTVSANVPLRINSERGRTEYLLVSLVQGTEGLVAYPMGKGSGSVTTFSFADGFIKIDQHTEILDSGDPVEVQLLGQELKPADLVIIGSHCLGLDFLIGELNQRGIHTKVLNVGSQGGLAAASRGECDIAGIHLLDEKTGEYNRPFLSDNLKLVPGYQRMQGVLYRKDDARFAGQTLQKILATVLADPECAMINRNVGSGTRILTDRVLAGQKPAGYTVQAKSHNAVATAVQQKRADWGIAIETVAERYQLGFLPIQEEHYDFVTPADRTNSPAIKEFQRLLSEPQIRDSLAEMGFRFPD